MRHLHPLCLWLSVALGMGLWPGPLAGAAPPEGPAHAWAALLSDRVPDEELLARVQDLHEDYDEAAEHRTEARFQQSLALADFLLEQFKRSDRPLLQSLVPKMEKLVQGIRARTHPMEVESLCDAIEADLVAKGGIPTAPRARPDLKRGSLLYRQQCAVCHGEKGEPPADKFAMMTPPPTNLVEAGNMNPLSPFRVYEAVSYGMEDTAMPAFSLVPSADRWALAFYVFTLRLPECRDKPPAVPLAELSTRSDNALVAEYGEASLSCIRRRLPTR